MPLQVLPGVHVLEIPLLPAQQPTPEHPLLGLIPEVSVALETGTPFDEKPVNKARYSDRRIHELKGIIMVWLRWWFR